MVVYGGKMLFGLQYRGLLLGQIGSKAGRAVSSSLNTAMNRSVLLYSLLLNW